MVTIGNVGGDGGTNMKNLALKVGCEILGEGDCIQRFDISRHGGK